MAPDFSTAFRLDGETALITGGATGLGLAMAQCMAAAGAQVVLVGRTADSLAEAARSIGPAARTVVQDVTAKEAPERLLQAAPETSILVNNAGVHLKKPALATTLDEFRQVLETHVMASFALSGTFAPAMIEKRRGSLLFVASMVSFIGMPSVAAYSAAKSAYLGLVRSLAAEFAQYDVRVNAIAPGFVETPMLRQALKGDPARQQKILSRTPMSRFGTPEDVGWAAVYLCSPAARFVTGAVLTVDGGAHTGF